VNALVLIDPAGMRFSVPLEMQLMRLPSLGPKLFKWFAKQEDMMKEVCQTPHTAVNLR
jgi:hypothetical protein